MTARMADSIVPANLPDGFDAYLGYVDGRWPDYQAIAARFGGKPVFGLTVFGALDIGDGTDAEPGDASIAQTVNATRAQLARGVERPIGYCPASWGNQMLNAHQQAGIIRPSWRLLTAHYEAGQHICGPRTCGLLAEDADGTQWIDHGPYDESLLNDGFLQAASHPGPAAAYAGVPTKIGADLMQAVPFAVTLDPNGWSAVDIPLPAGATKDQVVNPIVDWASAYDPGGWHKAVASVDYQGSPAGHARIVVSGDPGRYFTGRVMVSA